MIPVPELIEVAFPANVLGWMPAYKNIPSEFKDRDTDWVKLANYWFANGLNANVKFYAHEGVDAEQAFNAIRAVLGSYAPKHEHKIACAAYLMSEWFEGVVDYEHGKV